jgi:hypothetical protein
VLLACGVTPVVVFGPVAPVVVLGVVVVALVLCAAAIPAASSRVTAMIINRVRMIHS